MSEETQPTPGPENPWAGPTHRMSTTNRFDHGLNINVDGRGLSGPLQGFGPLWVKAYRARLPGLQKTAAEVMQHWKDNFQKFQPAGNHFYPSLAGLKSGEPLLLDAKVPALPGTPGLIPVATGMMVLYVDDVALTLITPEGHPESGWNTFSIEEEDGVLTAQIKSYGRSADPIYEFGYKVLGGESLQEKTWRHVLTQLAADFDVDAQVTLEKECIDPRYQWKEARNVWKNASVRTILYHLASPVRWLQKRFTRGKTPV